MGLRWDTCISCTGIWCGDDVFAVKAAGITILFRFSLGAALDIPLSHPLGNRSRPAWRYLQSEQDQFGRTGPAVCQHCNYRTRERRYQFHSKRNWVADLCSDRDCWQRSPTFPHPCGIWFLRDHCSGDVDHQKPFGMPEERQELILPSDIRTKLNTVLPLVEDYWQRPVGAYSAALHDGFRTADLAGC